MVVATIRLGEVFIGVTSSFSDFKRLYKIADYYPRGKDGEEDHPVYDTSFRQSNWRYRALIGERTFGASSPICRALSVRTLRFATGLSVQKKQRHIAGISPCLNKLFSKYRTTHLLIFIRLGGYDRFLEFSSILKVVNC